MAKTKDCDAATRRGRLKKAEQFLAAADDLTLDDAHDAYVTLYVHAGIAAADVLCCRALGVHAYGDDHNAAITLLERVDKTAAKHLRALLGLKTASGYSAKGVSRTNRVKAERAAVALVEAARST